MFVQVMYTFLNLPAKLCIHWTSEDIFIISNLQTSHWKCGIPVN